MKNKIKLKNQQNLRSLKTAVSSHYFSPKNSKLFPGILKPGVEGVENGYLF